MKDEKKKTPEKTFSTTFHEDMEDQEILLKISELVCEHVSSCSILAYLTTKKYIF